MTVPFATRAPGLSGSCVGRRSETSRVEGFRVARLLPAHSVTSGSPDAAVDEQGFLFLRRRLSQSGVPRSEPGGLSRRIDVDGRYRESSGCSLLAEASLGSGLHPGRSALSFEVGPPLQPRHLRRPARGWILPHLAGLSLAESA